MGAIAAATGGTLAGPIALGVAATVASIPLARRAMRHVMGSAEEDEKFEDCVEDDVVAPAGRISTTVRSHAATAGADVAATGGVEKNAATDHTQPVKAKVAANNFF